MTLPRAAICSIALAATLTGACAASTPRGDTATAPGPYLQLVNATFDSVTAVAVAPAGSEAFQRIALGQPLQGGLTATTFRVPPGQCLRDLRVTFRNQRVERLGAIDMCRVHALRLDAKPAR